MSGVWTGDATKAAHFHLVIILGFLIAIEIWLGLGLLLSSSSSTVIMRAGSPIVPLPLVDVAGSSGPTVAQLHIREGIVGGALKLPPGGKIPSRRLPQSRPKRLSNYSSFSCLGGSQNFAASAQWPEFLSQIDVLPRLDAPRNRICELRDVCVSGEGEIQYFVDAALEAAVPNNLRAEEALRVYSGVHSFFIKKKLWSPRFFLSARPQEIPFAPEERLYVLDQLSYVENYAHLLFDNLLPALEVAEVFGTDSIDVQLLGLSNCINFPDSTLIINGLPATTMCMQNIEKWTAALFTYPYLAPPFAAPFCVRRLLVGHAPSFSLASSYHHRVSTLRVAREAIHARLGVSLSVPLPCHRVLVYLARPEHRTPKIIDLCSDVNLWLVGLQPTIIVDCVRPAEQDLTEQVSSVSSATLFVVETGSTGYGAVMLGRPGSSAVVVVPTGAAHLHKEAQVFLFSDVHVYYHEEDTLRAPGGGQGALLLALERAGENLNLAPVRRAADMSAALA